MTSYSMSTDEELSDCDRIPDSRLYGRNEFGDRPEKLSIHQMMRSGVTADAIKTAICRE
jgi:hypothetical protein